MNATTILNDGRTVKTTLTDIICRTMPTAAVDSGFCSEIDVTARVAELADAIEAAGLFTPDVNLPRLQKLLAERGLPSSRMIAVPLYRELQRREMVKVTRK